MWTILFVNNVKCGHICACDSQPTIEHVLFNCILIANTRRIKWGQVENAMPLAMINSIESTTALDKSGCWFIDSSRVCGCPWQGMVWKGERGDIYIWWWRVIDLNVTNCLNVDRQHEVHAGHRLKW